MCNYSSRKARKTAIFANASIQQVFLSEAARETHPTSSADNPSASPQYIQRHYQSEPVSFNRGSFRHKNMKNFLDDFSLGAKLRWLSVGESNEVLRSKAELICDVLLRAGGWDRHYFPAQGLRRCRLPRLWQANCCSEYWKPDIFCKLAVQICLSHMHQAVQRAWKPQIIQFPWV